MAIDVYSYGMVASSTLYLLEGEFPNSDAYAEVKSFYRMTGGEAANSSIVLGKLGITTKLDGNWLGNDENGRNTRKLLDTYRVDTTRLSLKDGYQGVLEIVFADKRTRTVFGTYCKLLFSEKQWNTPNEADVKEARIVCLDPFFHDESLKVAEYCKAYSKPYVTIDCAPHGELSKNAAVVIISGEYRSHEYPGKSIEEVYDLYVAHANGYVIMTAGDGGSFYGCRDGERQFTPAYQIKPIDTAGAGDSFRSGIIYGMLQNWTMAKTVNFASAVAACVCASFPGVINAPNLEEVYNFIRNSGRALE